MQNRNYAGSVAPLIVAIALILGICFGADTIAPHVTSLFASPIASVTATRAPRGPPLAPRGAPIFKEGWQR